MANVKVTFDNIVVHNNGDGSGKGEIYYLFQVDGQTVSERTVSNTLKAVDGEVIPIGASRQVTKSSGQILSVFSSVSEKDDLSKDETDFRQLNFTESDNWGAGPHNFRLTDRKLDVTVNYRIDLV